MIISEPQVDMTGRYSQGETIKLLGISRSSLRRYTESGMLRFGIRKANNKKFYKGSEILRFWRTQI